MAKDETGNIARLVAEMSASTHPQPQADWKKQEKAARDGRVTEQVEVAQRVAEATLNLKDKRDREWYAEHLGRLSAREYRLYCQQEYGFDPGV
jgi:hypothetical protein